eukprot:scaffold17.g506.t1
MAPPKSGDALPDVSLDELGPDGSIVSVPLKELFKGKKGVLFGVPGAFTPGCSKAHLPGYIQDYHKLKDAGAEVVVCMAVRMLADTRAELTKALDIVWDATAVLGNPRCRRRGSLLLAAGEGGMGAAEGGGGVAGAAPPGTGAAAPLLTQCICAGARRRFSAVVEDGSFKTFNLEEGGGLTCSLSNQILGQLMQLQRREEEEREREGEGGFHTMRRHWGF